MLYEDFYNYKSGIYSYTFGKEKGGHAIKIVGYGIEKDTAYWLCANSWGTKFGMEGYFKIKQGESIINDAAMGCSPLL